MKKLIINFEMMSFDSSVKFTTTGELVNKRIKFTDNESSTHDIVFKNDFIEYSKKGIMEMKFKFDINRKTKGTYTVDNNSFEFDIITLKLENTSNNLVIKYDLIQNSEIVNSSTIKIEYSITKEE